MDIDAKYRTLWRRFLAGLIDFLVFVPLIGLQGTVLESRLPASLKACLTAVLIVCAYAYSIGMHWRFGATLGKMAVGIRVLDLGEAPISLRQALAREAINFALGAYSNVTLLALIASGQPLPVPTGSIDPGAWVSCAIFGLEVATALFNQKRRSLHDLIAGTVVVRESRRVIAAGSAGNAGPPGGRPIPPT